MQMAEKQLQAGDYSACLLTLSVLQQEQASYNSHIQAMTTVCNIHRFAALKQWNKVRASHKLSQHGQHLH